MKAGKFNINEYLDKLYEAEEEGGPSNDGKEGMFIPPENKKSFDWLRKEYDKGKTEVKVEMSHHDFKPGYSTEGLKDFKPGLYKQPSDAEAGKFPETKFPESGGRQSSEKKSEEKSEEKFDTSEPKKSTKKIPKVKANTTEKKKEEKKEKIAPELRESFLRKKKLNEASTEDIIFEHGSRIMELIFVLTEFEKTISRITGKDYEAAEEALEKVGYWNIIERYDEWGEYVDSIMVDADGIGLRSHRHEIAEELSKLSDKGYEARTNLEGIINDIRSITTRIK